MTEYAWVIEHRRSEPCKPEYWCGNGWHHDHLRAIRFARKVDAERTLSGFDEDDPLPDEQPHRIAEHGWTSTQPKRALLRTAHPLPSPMFPTQRDADAKPDGESTP